MGGSLVRRSQKCLQESRSMAEELRLGFEEAVRVEMPEGRARPAARSRACLALICCLMSLFTVAGLSTFLMVGQLRAQGKDCMPRVSTLAPAWGLSGLSPGSYLCQNCSRTALPASPYRESRLEGWEVERSHLVLNSISRELSCSISCLYKNNSTLHFF